MTKSTTAAARKRPSPEDQSERFKQAARDAECDEDEARWDERLRKIAQQKPREDKPE
jgi:hypothetical protein